MKTKVTVSIETETRKFEFGIWHYDDETDEGEFEPVSSQADLEHVAKELECKPDLVDLIMMNLSTLSDCVHSDVVAIWKRQDELEARIKALEERGVTGWTVQPSFR